MSKKMEMNERDIARFFRYVDKGECWLWTGGVAGKPDNTGQMYGKFKQKGATVLAHRFAYEAFIGPIPEGLTIDHLCKERSCVNPAHLEAVTMKENNLRGSGFARANANKTHCPRGHEYTPENTMTQPGGKMCATCRRAYLYWHKHDKTNRTFNVFMEEDGKRYSPKNYKKRDLSIVFIG